MRISDWSSDVCSSDLAALAALRQGKYEAFHFALMEGGGGLSQMEILAVADSVGLDSERLQREMQDPQITALLRSNHALAEQIGITGTPAFIIGHTLIQIGRAHV